MQCIAEHISKTDILLKKKSFYHKKTLAYIFSRMKSIEIDNMFDFLYAEIILNNPDLIEED